MLENTFVIAPSILAADLLHLGEAIASCEAAGADWIHVDVMDGHFVSNLTFGPVIVEACRRATNLPLDVHLMIDDPQRYMEAFARAGATNLTVHIETCPHPHIALRQIKSLGCRAGITLNPGTPAVAIQPVLPLVDLVLVMSVHPGFAEQKYLPQATSRVAEIRGMLDGITSSAWLEVDGGISVETLPEVREAGANAFVAAKAIFRHPGGITAGIQALRDVVASP
jgi:ribulose-phosphate 3-epimerase